MFFPIDILFLDRHHSIVSLIERLRPFRITRPRWAAHSVIELPAGTIERHGLQVGAGSVLLAGAATAAEPLQAGVSVMAEVAGLGRVGFRVEASA